MILLMEDGCVVEQGTHDELVRARGTPFRMVLRQVESAGENGEKLWR